VEQVHEAPLSEAAEAGEGGNQKQGQEQERKENRGEDDGGVGQEIHGRWWWVDATVRQTISRINITD
jgi:hypothetical protein